MSNYIEKEKNYFDIKNINEIADFEDYLSFAQNLVQRFEFDSEKKNYFKEQIEKISDKINDKKLNVSVVGEFSTGKSTFINALIGSHLLESNVLQGTTVATTVIEHGERYELILNRHDSTQVALCFDDLCSLREKVVEITTSPAEGKLLKSVNVKILSELFSNELRIIDTPGTNSTELWHEETTIAAIRETSDMSIVIVDATRPLPESWLHFLHNNLEDVIKQCIFVVTKLNTLPVQEQKMMMKFIKNKIFTEFGLNEPHIYFYNAIAVLKYKDGEYLDIEENEYRESLENEVQIMNSIKKCRYVSQAKKLINLIDEMYCYLSNSINFLLDDCEKELNVLGRSASEDFSSFVSQQKLSAQKNFLESTDAFRNMLKSGIKGIINNEKENVNSQVLGCKTIEELNNYLSVTIKEDIERCHKKLYDECVENQKDVFTCYKREINNFEKAFESILEKNDLVKVDFSEKEESNTALGETVAIRIKSATDFVTTEISKQSKRFWTGAIAGAAIGTAIPGLGTVLGFAIGAIGSFFFSNDKKVINQTYQKLQQPLGQCYHDMQEQAMNFFDNSIINLSKNINEKIDEIVFIYKDIVDNKVRETKNKEISIKNKHKELQSIVYEIESRKAKLENLSQNISKL